MQTPKQLVQHDVAVASWKAEIQQLKDQIAILEGSWDIVNCCRKFSVRAEKIAADTQDMHHALWDKLEESLKFSKSEETFGREPRFFHVHADSPTPTPKSKISKSETEITRTYEDLDWTHDISTRHM